MLCGDQASREDRHGSWSILCTYTRGSLWSDGLQWLICIRMPQGMSLLVGQRGMCFAWETVRSGCCEGSLIDTVISYLTGLSYSAGYAVRLAQNPAQGVDPVWVTTSKVKVRLEGGMKREKY